MGNTTSIVENKDNIDTPPTATEVNVVNTEPIISNPATVTAVPDDENTETNSSGGFSEQIEEEATSIQEAADPDSILVRTIKKLSTVSNYILFMVVVISIMIPILILGFTKTRFKDAHGKERVMKGADKNALIICGSIIGILIVVVAIMLLYVKTFRHIGKLLGKLSNVWMLILFIVGFIILHVLVQRSFLERYRLFVLPLTMIVAGYFFYKSLQRSKEEKYVPNIQVEKIRTSVVYLMFLVFVSILFACDTGGFIKNLFGPALAITLSIIVLGFVYLLNIFSFPLNENEGESKNSISGFTLFGIGNLVFFLILVGLFVTALFTNKREFTNSDLQFSFENKKFTTMMSLFIVLLILWAGFFCVTSVREPIDKLSSKEESKLDNIRKIAQQLLNVILGLGLVGTVIYWILFLYNSYEGDRNIMSLLANIFMMLVILIFVYKFIANSTLYQNSPYYKLAINVIFYIPCLIYDTIVYILSFIGIKLPSLSDLANGTKNAFKNAKLSDVGTSADLYFLFVVIILYLSYFVLIPLTANKVAKQGGKIVLTGPEQLGKKHILGDYFGVNGIERPDDKDSIPKTEEILNYKYAISFWLHVGSSSTSLSDTYYSVLNFGDMPNIKWNPKRSILAFVVKNTDTIKPTLQYPEEYDADGNIILYKFKAFKLQKWNHIAVNYVNGTFDVFINGKLHKTKAGVVPKITSNEVLQCGSKHLVGKICNIVYFNHSIDMNNVHYLYNLLKEMDPPLPTYDKTGTLDDPVYSNIKKAEEDITNEIKFNLDLGQLWVNADKATTKAADALNPPTRNENYKYLSLGWYFAQNKDEMNNWYGNEDQDKKVTGEMIDIKDHQVKYGDHSN